MKLIIKREIITPKKILLILLALLLLYFTFNFKYYNFVLGTKFTSANPSLGNSSGKLAIIIDDFGQDRDGVYEMMSIKRHITFAVMPFLEFSEKDAKNAYITGHEVIVHLPMQSKNGKLSWVGPRPILASMNKEEVSLLVDDCIKSIPHAVGANNHMGSLASGKEEIIAPVLDKIKENGMYYVDSRTARNPVAKKLCDSMDVLCYDRNVFLDGKKSKEVIKKKLLEAGELALEKGYAVAIGHVGTEGGVKTAEAITEMLPVFDERNIKLVYVSELKEK